MKEFDYIKCLTFILIGELSIDDAVRLVMGQQEFIIDSEDQYYFGL